MFIDIVFPKGNEEEFIENAKLLGCNGLIFVYEDEYKKNLETVKMLNSVSFKVFSGLVINNKHNSKYDFLFSYGSRNHFENKKTSVVFDLENQFKNDNPHFRNSGLNQVLCSLAKQNNILIGLDFNSLLNSNEKSMIMGRMIQNAFLCKKYGVKMLIASFARNPSEMRYWKDLISFGITIGMTPKQAKEAVMNRKV